MSLTWEDTYALAEALRQAHPQIDLQSVSLGMVYQWTIDLPNFIDDPRLANDGILLSIFQEWYEEENSL